MDELGVGIIFVLPGERTVHFPRGSGASCDKNSIEPEEMHGFRNICFRPAGSALRPYANPGTSQTTEQPGGSCRAWAHPEQHEAHAPGAHEPSRQPRSFSHYGPDIFQEVRRFAETALRIAQAEDFDLIHAHDWMTFPAGIAVARMTGRPLIVHVHSTEFDRSGQHVNQGVYGIERQGMHAADKVITVSNYTKNMLLEHYGLSAERIEVVYNGAAHDQPPANLPDPQIRHFAGSEQAGFAPQSPSVKTDKVVLFLGRITMQKGPEYFLRAAKRVLEKMDNVKFIMAGDGDMLYQSINLAAELRIGHKVFFPRFLRGDDVHRAYGMADLYVMPSVSEPFGIAPLEALQHDVPVLISKQSGIGETLRNALKVDFWDIDEMANKMVAVLRHPSLDMMLSSEGHKEVARFRWEDSAARILSIYAKVLRSCGAVVK
jgi:glycosyltransferase involved in cell wall biosynthesis